VKVCTFFGHRDTPESVMVLIREVLIELIEHEKSVRFLVGSEGSFDKMVTKVLKELMSVYRNIECDIVVAYLDGKNRELLFENTVFPEGLECVPKKFAIEYRNRWMLKQSDYIVAYVNRPFGGAAKFVELAEKQNITVINLAKQKT